MSMETQRTGQLGINVVERVVLQEWRGRWQQLESQHDDGVDGLIFLESGGVPTGQIVFVQVKCTSKNPGVGGKTSVPIAAEKLKMNFERWRRVVGAAIMVHVHAKTLVATWVDLRAPGVLTKAQAVVPSEQLFNASARKKVAALCGTLYRDMLMRRLVAKATDFSYLTERVSVAGKKSPQELHVQRAARQYYTGELALGVGLAKGGPLVQFSRDGWRHITRPQRKRLVVLQSFQLLGVAKRIISSTEEKDLKEIRPAKGDPVEYVYAIAVVSFSFRQTGVVKVILRRHAGNGGLAKYSFHTVYEPRRRKDILGNA
ncbi:DUF4365 domain-containing protein [Paraburkholderia fungorum]|uniref:DUF4365 domain-containing protein n=1 Tax=Paraburkholderia fungorum TaxID=134537 RepID=UPI00047FC3B0|nr:DUF4365 domain-containing protein [Paraburkholderia fungorum]MBB5546993.1 hypothetical protein [Paraburkholderia fungorum]PNE55548.1 DUF4365 domain-containing protein [Paraburkholderia fungorum]